MTGLRFRWLLSGANLTAWLLLVLFREPLPAEYFQARDQAAARGGFLITSADPIVVIGGRPLRTWSEWHGGEASLVKLLEVVNILAVTITVFAGFLLGLTGLPTYRRSFVTLAILLIYSSIQWWFVGWGIDRFRAGR
jgi:hypothetical protein